MEKIYNNDENITIEDYVNEVQGNEKVKTIYEEGNMNPRYDFKDKCKRVRTDGSKKGFIGLDCNQCESVYVNKTGLNTHMKSVHEGVKYECNQCNYKATTKGSHKCHTQTVHK